MTRRRVIFVDADGAQYVTPEFNGDKSEFALRQPASLDACSMDWCNVLALFSAATTLPEFVKANVLAQADYQSVLGAGGVFPVLKMGKGFRLPATDEFFRVYHPEFVSGATKALRDRVLFWAESAQYTHAPLMFLKLSERLSAVDTCAIIAAFDDWYGSTDQDTTAWALEFQLFVRMLVRENALVVNPRFLDLGFEGRLVPSLLSAILETPDFRLYAMARELPPAAIKTLANT